MMTTTITTTIINSTTTITITSITISATSIVNIKQTRKPYFQHFTKTCENTFRHSQNCNEY